MGDVKTGPMGRHLGDSHEVRRLRAMLTAVQEHEGGLLGYMSIKADPQDGIVTILCMPRGDEEAEGMAGARAFGEAIMDAHAIFAHAFVQVAAESLHCDRFEALTQEAAQRLIDAWEHKEASRGDNA